MTRRGDWHFDDAEFTAALRKLTKLRRRGIPFAVKGTLNTAAFTARPMWQREIKDQMITRNTWTTRRIGIDKARGRGVDAMKSTIGHTEEYMRQQEEGDVVAKSGKHGKPIPTTVASGEGRSSGPRRRLVRRPNRMGSIVLTDRRGTSRRQRNAIAISMAMRAGRRYVFLELSRARQGIFRIMGGRRRPRIEMIWDLSRASIRIPKNPTLEPTMKAMERKLPRIAVDEIQKQIRFSFGPST